MSDPRPNSLYPPLAGKVIVLTGPTASGKSDAALRLAQSVQWDGRQGGEILSLDALAVYRGMDIGTAKPSPDDQSKVAHHMIDLVDPDQDFSVAEYLRIAHERVREIRQRNRVPIFVGGTPMYLKAILRGFDPGPPADAAFRSAVETDVELFGAEALHKRLAAVDPLSAHRIDPGDVRRMIRALEVARATGVPISHRQTQFDRPANQGSSQVYAIRWPRPLLHDRINRRVDGMFQRGLVAEVEQLIADGGTLSRTAAQAVGYRELISYLDHMTGDDAVDHAALKRCHEEVAAHTRQLARRQETWFRSFQEISFIDVDHDDQIIDQLSQHACLGTG